ncbi:hypothetical protein GCM10009737_15590 [Nocardioides lentus]|uniref:HNH nuclease domain-containing protein n=1 Tax=Nocardioides lentus TaxID=338077 RepID=A0ABN2PA50_9ACTN
MVTSAALEARWGGGSHPLVGGVQTMIATLDEMTTALAAGSDPSWLPTAEQGYYLASLQQIADRVTTMKQAALAALDDAAGPGCVQVAAGARSAADWLAHRTCANPRRLAAEARLGARITRRIHLSAAMLDGLVSPEHARVVVECLDALPVDLLATNTDPSSEESSGEESSCADALSADALSADELVEAVELQLIEYCTQFSPAEVARLARHVLEVVDPDRAEQIEAERLARAERDAWRRTKLTTRGIGEGFIRVTADLPALHASILDTVLDTLTQPPTPVGDEKPDGQTSDGQKPDDGQYLSGAQRRGQAFCTLLENLDTTTLPQRHGTSVAVTVVVDEERLRREVSENGLASTTTGVDLSLEQARRLMCGAGIWPAVMGGASVVLDAGRTRRFFDGRLRAALEVAHTVCQAVGCTIPAAWCDGHHRTPWAHGGTTTVTDGALLCPHHHRRVHDTRYDTHWSATGEATFHRRQ